MNDLKDFRGKITVETHCVLEAENRVTGEDKSEIVRNILHEWAVKKLGTYIHDSLPFVGKSG